MRAIGGFRSAPRAAVTFFVCMLTSLIVTGATASADQCLSASTRDTSAMIDAYLKSECSIRIGLELNRRMLSFLDSQQESKYLEMMKVVSQKLQQARKQAPQTAQCEEQFCSPERETIDLIMSMQETWNHFYMEFIISTRWNGEMMTAGKVAGLSAVGAGLLYMFVPRFLMRGYRIFAQIGKSILRRLGGSQLGSRLFVTQTGTGVGLLSGRNPPEAKKDRTVAVYPSPLELMDVGKLPADAQRAVDEGGIFTDLTWDMLGLGGSILSGILIGNIAERLVPVFKKPSVFAAGFFATYGYLRWRSNEKFKNHKSLLEEDIALSKLRLAHHIDKFAFEAYLDASRFTTDIEELSWMFTQTFEFEVQGLEAGIYRGAQCWPYEFGPVPEGDVDRVVDLILKNTNSQLNDIRARHSATIAQNSKDLQAAATYLDSLGKFEFYNLSGRLKTKDYVLNTYANDPGLFPEWRTQVRNQLSLANHRRSFLDMIWTKYQNHEAVPAADIKTYKDALQNLKANGGLESHKSSVLCVGVNLLPAVSHQTEVLHYLGALN